MSQKNFYSNTMSKKSDADLKAYIDNKDDYQEEAVLAAVWELENRNLTIPNLAVLKEDLEQVVTKEEAFDITTPDINFDAPTAKFVPSLYSARFIMIFGILFSVFAGSILMAMNFVRLDKKKLARLVLLAGLSYSFLQVLIFDYLKVKNTFISVMSSLLGVYLLHFLFWQKNVEDDSIYPKRNAWNPVIIALGITLPIIYFMMKSGILVQ